MLILDVQDDMRFDFEIEFDFKTVRSEAILFYVDVIESDTSIEYIFGYIEVRRFICYIHSTFSVLYVRYKMLTIHVFFENLGRKCSEASRVIMLTPLL